MSLVLDASVALTWCFEDERTPDSLRLLGLVAEGGAVVAPIWRAEVANGLLVAERRNRLDERTRAAMLDAMSSLAVRTDPEAERLVWTVTSELAGRHGLTIYDASYLEIAMRLRLPLATRDRALARAATTVGIAAA